MVGYDCLVIGGGPAGCLAAACVARAGWRTLLVERERHAPPRPAGLLTPAAMATLRRCGMEDLCARGEGLSARRLRIMNCQGAPIASLQLPPAGGQCGWQVARAILQEQLLDRAAEAGAEICKETTALAVEFDSGRAVGARLETAGGAIQRVTSRLVIDASGRRALLGRQLGLHRADSFAPRTTIWGWYQGVVRDGGEAGQDALLFRTTNRRAWFQLIPLPGDITCLSLTGEEAYLLQDRGTPEEIIEDELVQCPALAARLMDARLAERFVVERHEPFRLQHRSGPGWCAIDIAGSAIDPLCLGRLSLAVQAGAEAGAAADRVLRLDDCHAGPPPALAAHESARRAANEWTALLYEPSLCIGELVESLPGRESDLASVWFGEASAETAAALLADASRFLAERTSVSQPAF